MFKGGKVGHQGVVGEEECVHCEILCTVVGCHKVCQEGWWGVKGHVWKWGGRK